MDECLSGLLNQKTKAGFQQISRPMRRLAKLIVLGSIFATPALAQSCFKGQIDGPHADNIANSTVSLVRLDDSGQPLDYGTGFIIRNSEGKEGVKRVVTALHVSGSSLVEAYSSSGRKLGLLKSAVASGTLTDRSEDSDVLRFTSLTKGSARIIAGIRGLDIDPTQSQTGILTGLFEHGAPLPGNSGAAVVGHDSGRVKGIMTDYFTIASIPDLKRKGPHFYTFDRGEIWSNGKKDEEFSVKEKARWFAIALTSPKVLAALGKAGKHVVPSLQTAEAIDVAGFTSGYCMATTGTMKQLDPSDPTDFDLETPTTGVRRPVRVETSRNTYATGWNNPAVAVQKLSAVLKEAQIAAPHNSELSATLDALREVKTISHLPLVSAWHTARCQNMLAAATLNNCRLSISQVMDTLEQAAQAAPKGTVHDDLKATLTNLPYGYIRASWFTGNLNARLSR
jgi:hypothetical protein